MTLKLAGLAESVVVQGPGSRIEARNPGFGTSFGPGDLRTLPTRRASIFDFMRATPGISPTSPPSGTITTICSLINPQNNQQRVLLETRGTRRRSSQTLRNLRLSRAFPIGGLGRLELLCDVLNAPNDGAEESLASDDLFSATFGQPAAFVDPRRAMVGITVSFGR